MDTWDLSGQRAAASRERAAAMHELLARLSQWLHSRSTIRAPALRARDCVGADC